MNRIVITSLVRIAEVISRRSMLKSLSIASGVYRPPFARASREDPLYLCQDLREPLTLATLPVDNPGTMRFLRNQRAKREIERLIRQGVGVHERSFVWLAGDATRAALADAAMSWMRSEAGRMRRPYGVDQMVVAMACRNGRGQLICTNSFGVIRPTAFYDDEGK